jgi:PKD-like domain/Bacterial Ig-like domain (group 2)
MKKLFTLLIALFCFVSMSLGQTTTQPVLMPGTNICISPPSTLLGVSFTYSGGLPNTSTTVKIQLGNNTFGTIISTTDYTFTTDVAGGAVISTSISLVANAATDGANRRVRILNDISTIISTANSNPIAIRIQPTADVGANLVACQSSSPTAIILIGATIGGPTTVTGAWSIISGGGSLSSTLQTATPEAVTYTPAPGYTGPVVLRLTTNTQAPCVAATDDLTINVNPEPTLTGVTATPACAGSDVTVTAAGLLPNTSGVLAYTSTGTPSSGTYSYTSNGSGFVSFPISGAVNGDVIEITSLNITSTTCSKSFSGIITAALVVNPIPLTALTGPTSVCEGTLVTINSLISPATTPNYAHSWNVVGAFSGLSLGTTSASTASSASFTPTLPQGTITVEYNVTDGNGCVATQTSTVVTVTAPPIVPPAMAPITQCDNSNFTLAGSLAGQPIGTTGTWSVMSGVATITTPSSPTSTVTSVSGIAVLKWTVMNGSCGTQSATVTLTNQAPRLTSNLTPAAICSGSTFSYTATGTPSGAAFTWSRAAVPGISQGASTGSNGNISEVLTNTTNANVTVTYVFVVSANACTAAIPENVTVVVRPTPNVTTSFTPSTCSGGGFSIMPVNGIDGIIPSNIRYTWSAPTVTGGITGGAASGLIPPTSIFASSLTNPTGAIQTATYTVTPSLLVGLTLVCQGTPFIVVVTVNPKPSITNIPATATTPACSGVAFAAVTPVNGLNGIVPSGTTYAWSAPTGSVTGGMAGTGSSITGTLSNGSGVNQTATYSVTPTAGGCVGAAFTVAVTIKPTPTFSSGTTTPAAICSGDAAIYNTPGGGATFSWTRAATVSDPAAASTGSINEILHNTTTAPIVATYLYTVTLNGCVNSSSSNTVTVTVNPTPVITDMTSITCSNVAFTVTPLHGPTNNGIVPTITTYSWSAPSVPITITGATGGSGSALTGTLVNSTASPIAVTYVVTPTAGTCVGAPFNVVVTVNPNPAITPMTATICSGGSFSVTPQNVVDGAVPAGTTYTWGLPTGANITGGATDVSLVDETSITGTLTNTSRGIRTAIYTVTPSFAGCAGTPFTVTITVNPKPSITDMTASTCSGVAFTVNPVNGVNGLVPNSTTTYSWSAPSVTGGMLGAAGTGTSVTGITGTLTNNTAIDQTATYVVTPTASATLGGCVGATFQVVVTVKPTPVITGPLVVCEDGGTITLLATPRPVSTLGSWLSATPAVATIVSTGLVTGLENGLVAGVAAGTSVITYTASNGCSNSVTVTVNAEPVIAALTTTVCAGSPFALIPDPLIPGNIIPSGTTYSWSAPLVTVGNITGGVGGINASIINGTLVNTLNTQGTVVYTVTPSANGCVGLPFTVTVNVDPKPAVTVPAQSICSGSAFTITPSNGALNNGIVPSGTTYTWSIPSVSGITGPIVGGTNSSSFTTGTLTNSTTGPINVVYSVTPTSGSCTGAPFTITVTVKPTPVVATPAPLSVCNGGTVTAVLTGTIIPSGTTYAWPSGTGLTFGPLSNLGISPSIITYSVTPTFNGCVGAAFPVQITVNPTPTVTGNLIICKGLTTQLTGSTAGSGTATPTWLSATTTVATVSATGLVTGENAGTSVITYTDNNGCTKTVTVTVNPKPSVTIASTANFISQGCTLPGVTATITGGTGPYSPGGWSSTNNALVSFSNVLTLSTSVVASTSPVVTTPTNVTINFEANDANGCVTEATPLVLTIYPVLTANVTGVNNLCIGATAPFASGIAGGYAAGTGTGTPTARTIIWASDDDDIATVSSTGLVTGVSAGTAIISVTVTDASGCSATSSQSVTIKAAPALTAVVNNVSCLNSANGVICLSGQLPLTTYTYAWSNSAPSASCNPGLVPGTYAVTITDISITCPQIIPNIAITSPTAVLSASISGTTAVCQGSSSPLVTFTGTGGTGTFGIGGTGTYTFTYTIGVGPTFTVTTAPGNSTVTVSAPTGTTGTFVYALVDVTSAACNATATGSVAITVDASLPPLSPAVNAGVDQSGLLANTATLTHSAIPTSPAGLTGTWSVVPANASVTFTSLNPATATTTVSNLPAGATTLRWTIAKGACKISDDVILELAKPQANIFVVLEGALGSTAPLMDANLRTLPNSSTYFASVPSGVLALTNSNAIVDFITIELRSDLTTISDTRIGLLRRDGKVVEIADGVTPLSFNVVAGSYFVFVKHRNHLGFRTEVKQLLSTTSIKQVNFAITPSIAHDGFNTGLKVINFGAVSVNCAWAGDGNGDDAIDIFDFTLWFNSNGQSFSTNEPEDYNLDGDINILDYVIWFNNKNKDSQF